MSTVTLTPGSFQSIPSGFTVDPPACPDCGGTTRVGVPLYVLEHVEPGPPHWLNVAPVEQLAGVRMACGHVLDHWSWERTP